MVNRVVHFLASTVSIVFCFALFPASAPAQAEPGNVRSLITGPIDESHRTVLRGSTHPSLQNAIDMGPVDRNLGMERMLLVLGSSPEQEEELGQLIKSLHDKTSLNYHQWLTPDQFGKKFGLSTDDSAKVGAWLTSQGFVLNGTARSGRWIEFSGTPTQVERAFQTQMRSYVSGGQAHIANATDISVPSALAPAVKGVFSLHDFFTRPVITDVRTVRRDPQGKLVPVNSDGTFPTSTGAIHLLTPSDYANIYDIIPLYQAGFDGAGQTIAIVARSNISLGDIETFREIFDLPPNDPNIIVVEDNGDFTDSIEATLDAEWAGAIAPRATVDLVVNTSTATTDGVALSAAYIIDNNLAPIMSVSFGECEQDLGGANAFYNALWQQAAAQGISVFISSGDSGAAGCDNPSGGVAATAGLAVSGLASTPFNTAVGGTEFSENGQDATFWSAVNSAGFESALGYIPETVWNESCVPNTGECTNIFSLFAGSGGVSTLYPVPAWQTLNIEGLHFTNRALPDLALTAAAGHDGYLLCFVGSCVTTTDDNLLNGANIVGGTSASSPGMAAITALIEQKLGGRQGLANYALYQIALNENFSNCNSTSDIDPTVHSQCTFNDITTGNNSVPGQSGFNAASGFDLATGLGSVNASNLANAWSALVLRSSATTLNATSATSVGHGTAISFSIAVNPNDGNPGTPSGAVSLVSDKDGPVASAALTNGVFGGSFTSLPGGSYNLTAHFPGNGVFSASDSTSIPVNIAAESSTLTISAFTTNGIPAGNSIFYGQFLGLLATVTSASGQGVATGTITFSDTFNGSTTQLASVPVNAQGSAQLISFGFITASLNLAIGTHSIVASYGGDSSFKSATSAPFVLTVNKGSSNVAVETSATSVPSTEQVLIHAFISGSAGAVGVEPSGTVQLLDNGLALGAAVPVPSVGPGIVPQVSVQTLLIPGAHSLAVQYSGDSNYNPSVSSTIAVTVTPVAGIPTQTRLVAATTTPVVRQLTTYEVTVSSSSTNPALTGTVQLITDDLGPVGNPAALNNGKAIISYQWGFGGPERILAQYSGDANYATSASAPMAVNVSRTSLAISLSSSAETVAPGAQVSLTATILAPPFPLVFGGPDPDGLIQFFDSVNGGSAQPIGTPLSTHAIHLGVAISEGYKAVAVLPVVPVTGAHNFTAQYLGDCCFLPASSAPVSVTVGQRNATTTTVAADSLQPAFGQTVHFTISVTSSQTSPAITGTVQIVNPTFGVLGNATLASGSATVTIPWTVGGFQSVYAQYSGDDNYASSDSNLVNLTVPTFELLLSANALPIPAGQNAGASLTVVPEAGYRGTVLFTCGAGIPAGATCSFFPSSVTPNGSAVTSVLVVQTLAPSPQVTGVQRVARDGWWGISLIAGIVALACIVVPSKSRMNSAAMLILICAVAFGIGCGGGGSSGPTGGPTPTPTPIPTPTPNPSPTPTANTTTSMSSSGTKIASGDTVTFTAAVMSNSGNPLTGTVSFLDGQSLLGSPVNLVNGSAQLQASTLSVGTHNVTARYNGDSVNTPSTSGVLEEAVTGAATFQVTASDGSQTKTLTVTALVE